MKRAYILAITVLLLTFGIAFAGNIQDVIGHKRNTSSGSYLYMKQDGSAHVYFAIYDVAFNYGSVKSRESTHDGDYIRNRPEKTDEDGYLTTEWLKWLATLEYKHMTEEGERLYLISKSGLDSTSLTEKSGKYYLHIWGSDEDHANYVAWCKKNGVKLKGH